MHTLDPKESNSREPINTFKDYADHVFNPTIKKMLEPVLRLDIVWDTYIPNSLKEQTRQNRGTGTPMKVEIILNFQETGKTFYVVTETKKSYSTFLQLPSRNATSRHINK